MTEAQSEDTQYIPSTVDDFAIADEDSVNTLDDEMTPEKLALKEIRDYCKKAIKDHNSFDVLNLPQNATPEQKCAVFDEMFNHKGLVHHLRQVQQIIENNVKEN